MSPAKRSAKKPTKKPAKKSAARGASNKGLSREEIAAMKETLKERKAAAQGADGETALLAKIAEMPEPDRAMAKRLHALIRASAPTLSPKTWYGMPAYANADGKVVCFFQSAAKFNARYATLGFSDSAHLDDGVMWPISYALKDMTPAEETKIAAMVKQAVG